MAVIQTFEHNGRVLQISTYETSSKPEKVLSRRAPGAGNFEIGQINLSVEKISAGEELTLSAQVSGKNIAYIYTEILLKDKDLNQFYGPVAREYIRADRNKESRGIIRPDWDENLNLSVTLRPRLNLLTDGVDSAFAFLIPEGYDSANRRLDGTYTTADRAAQHRARITFDSNGEIKDILDFKEQGKRSLPHALTPKLGDQFTPFAPIFTPPADENQKWQGTTGLSTPLTFREQPLRLITEMPIPTEYLVGLVIQDLDSTFTRKYVPLIIQ